MLEDDERIRDQLETLVSPSCSCKQAEVCVVSVDALMSQPVDLHSNTRSGTESMTSLSWYKGVILLRNSFILHLSPLQRDITKKLGSPKQPSNPFLEMVKFLLERIAPVHIDTESIRCVCVYEDTYCL